MRPLCLRLRRARLVRLCAIWLVVLTVLPFTAPFAALDVADLLGGERTQKATATVSPPLAGNPQADEADDVTVSDVSTRIRPLDLSERVLVASAAAGDPTMPAITIVVPTAAANHDEVPALVVNLRV